MQIDDQSVQVENGEVKEFEISDETIKRRERMEKNEKWKEQYLIKELQRHLPDATEEQLQRTIEGSHKIYEKLLEKIKLSKERRILPNSFEESLSVRTEEYKALFPNDDL